MDLWFIYMALEDIFSRNAGEEEFDKEDEMEWKDNFEDDDDEYEEYWKKVEDMNELVDILEGLDLGEEQLSAPLLV